MMSIKIRYKVYPDDPVATEKSRLKAYGNSMLSMIAGFGALASVCYFINSTISLFKESDIESFVYSIAFITLMAIIIFLPLMNFFDNIVEAVKKYFLFFISGLICTIGLIGAIIGGSFLLNGESGLLLIISIVGIVFVSLITWLLYSKWQR